MSTRGGTGAGGPRRAHPSLILLLGLALAAAALTGCGHHGHDDPAAEIDDWWRPTADRPLELQWVLGGSLDRRDPTDMGRVDLAGGRQRDPDVYDLDGDATPRSTVAALHAHHKTVICSFDAGVYESSRPDAKAFQALKPRIWGRAGAQGGPGGSSPADASWLDIRRVHELEPIMKARIDQCRRKGFDAVEPQEIDGYAHGTGFPLTAEDQLRYDRALARWAHEAGLSIGQKGDIDQAEDLWPSFDWALDEGCYQDHECAKLDPYIVANKAVWIAEYPEETRPHGGRWPASAVRRIHRKAGDAYVLTSAVAARLCRDAAEHRFNLVQFRLGLPEGPAGGRRQCHTLKARKPLITKIRPPANP